MKKMIAAHNISVAIVTFGIALVLIWIGIFKFTPTEAQSIVDLVGKSPLLSWMYKLFSVQTTSKIIGCFEIITAILLLVGFIFPKLGVMGSCFSIIIFFTTCTFIFTTGGVLEKIDGLWVPSDLGSFLIKDVVALGSSLFLLTNYLQKIS